METATDNQNASGSVQGKKRGRRPSVRECEESGAPRRRWCRTCQNPRLKKPCEGLHPPTQIDNDSAPLADAGARTAISTADEIDPPCSTTSRRNTQPPARLEYPLDQIRDRRVNFDLAMDREKAPKKPKVSVLLAELAERSSRLALVEDKVKQLVKELTAETRRADNLAREKIARDAPKRQKTLTHFFRPAVDRATTSTATSTIDADKAVGYSDAELRRKFRRDVENVQTHILDIAGDDPLRQLQLADGAFKRFTASKERLMTDEQQAGRVVLSCLRDFFGTLRQKYAGRFPNLARAIQQAVGVAIGATAPRGTYAKIASAAGCSLSTVSNGHARWHEWLRGERVDLVDLRGAERSDKIPTKWVDHAREQWLACTVKSPKKKDSVRNPHNRRDKELYRVHFKEMRTYEIHAIIVRTGVHASSHNMHMCTHERTRTRTHARTHRREEIRRLSLVRKKNTRTSPVSS